jgi:hypothetical protein
MNITSFHISIMTGDEMIININVMWQQQAVSSLNHKRQSDGAGPQNRAERRPILDISR